MIRGYQNDCVDAIQREFDSGVRSTAAVLATALGKTTICAEFIRRVQPARGIFLCHRDILATQARNTIERIAGVKCGIEVAELKADYGFFSKEQIVISTIQTQNAGNSGKGRMHLFRPSDFEYIFCDELHHFIAPSFRKVIEHYQQNPRAKLVGFTATPDRSDGEALGQIIQTTAYEYDILEGISDGWLVPIAQQFVPVAGLDYSHISTTAGDLNLGQLSAVMEEEETVQRMIQPTLEAAWCLEPHRLDFSDVVDWGTVMTRHGRPKRTLVFCTSVKQAQRFAEVMNRVKSGMATAIWDKVPKNERRTIFSDFKTGALQVLVNVGICGEGFDAPSTELLVMGRATKSRSLYTQFLGRALRPLDDIAFKLNDAADAAARRMMIEQSGKPIATILDFVGNSGRHKLITSADILGGKVSDKAIENAKKKLLKSEKATPITELLELTEEQVRKRIEDAKKLAEERRTNLVARVQYSTVLVDPFDAMDISPAAPKAFDAAKKLSEKQVLLMRRFGLDASKYPYTQAKQLFVQLCNQLHDRKATPPQIALLKSKGYENAKEMPYKEAKQLIDNLRNNGWKRPVTKPEIMDL